MPIAGLPTTLEAALSSLLGAESLTSWKIDGTTGQTVVILRFTQGQPLPDNDTVNNARGSWRRKPPSQLQRDRRRAEQFRELRNTELTQLTHLSDESLRAREQSNPAAAADIVNENHYPSPNDPSLLTSDPPTNEELVGIGLEQDSCVMSAEEKVSSMTEHQSQPDCVDSASSEEDLPSGVREIVQVLRGMNASIQRSIDRVDEDFPAKATNDRDDISADPPPDRRLPSHAHLRQTERSASPRRPVQISSPDSASVHSCDPSRSHGDGDRPTLRRQQPWRSARKT